MAVIKDSKHIELLKKDKMNELLLLKHKNTEKLL
jgi:hypothetical protein